MSQKNTKFSVMTKEEQKELLSDICSRLPYGVKCTYYDKCIDEQSEGMITGMQNGTYFAIDGVCIGVENVKPYLFPMSSMTEEQRKEYEDAITYHGYIDGGWAMVKDFDNEYVVPYWFVDFCNKTHLDYRGWINVGLAIDATNLNIY